MERRMALQAQGGAWGAPHLKASDLTVAAVSSETRLTRKASLSPSPEDERGFSRQPW